jgi:hypothetical protein
VVVGHKDYGNTDTSSLGPRSFEALADGERDAQDVWDEKGRQYGRASLITKVILSCKRIA